MKIEQFRYFVTIDLLGSISAAAKFYSMNQNTLSTIVRQAEEEYGIKIFQRTPNGIISTEDGKVFVDIAKEIDMGYSRIMSIKKQAKVKASVVLVMDAISCSVLAMPITEAFYKSGSRGNLRFWEKESSNIISQMYSDHSKMTILRLGSWNRAELEKQKERLSFSVETLASDELCLAVGKTHPLAACEAVSAEQLLPYRIVWHQAMEQEVRSILGERIKECAGVATRCCDKHLAEAVSRRQMVAVVSRLSARNEPDWHEGEFRLLRLIGTEQENRQELVLCYRTEDLGRPRYQVMRDLLPALVRGLAGEEEPQ